MNINAKDPEYFDPMGRFIQHDYNHKTPFSSFLPGISGLNGIPMWVFYTNRGQAISSFGIESKDHPILEFQSANKAYQLTEKMGFRTFLKTGRGLFEPFTSIQRPTVARDMYIGMNELEIRETDLELELETRVLYFNLTNMPPAGFVRQISFKNFGQKALDLEVLDGLPAFIPYGVNNEQLKHISRTIEAWIVVLKSETNLPYYQLRASAEDRSEIRTIQSGNYAMAASSSGLLPVIVDPRLIFGSDCSFRHPRALMDNGLASVLHEHQIQEGRTPCAFFGDHVSLAPGETRQINSIYGSANDYSQVKQLKSRLLDPDFVPENYRKARELALQLTDPIATLSANQLFDAYCRQTFLDNLLRGGYPRLLGGKHIYHTYSRKHGDPERDYNHFFLAAEEYSQGNGSYRDVNQNRRGDVLFEPLTADFNIRLFMSLIQLDGYNPLVVEGTRFTLEKKHWRRVLNLVRNPEILSPLLRKTFTPGQLMEWAQNSGLSVEPGEFIEQVIGRTEQHIQAQFGEGYWVDHWTYNLDLIDSYLILYPDRKMELLFDADLYPFFDSPAFVNPRSQKYVLDDGVPKQFNAILIPEDKLALINNREWMPNWARAAHGQGEIFRLNLFSKLTLLAILKFATRDPQGMGLEMEAGKPGWDDALNGLPGMFGSSLSESFELVRLLDFLIGSLDDRSRSITLPIEGGDLLDEILTQLGIEQSPFEYWDSVSTAREDYREKTFLGVDGDNRHYTASNMLIALRKMRQALEEGIDQALLYGSGIAPTYFSFQVIEFEILNEKDPENRPFIKPSRFEVHPLPLFLESPVHQLKILHRPDERFKLYRKVRKSNLFDPKLNTYKLNTSLTELPYSIGRARAFSRGWLENESIWLHMTLKYLLEILKAGLYEEFFTDIQNCLPPFLDPETYGRSLLENSSFIVSSVHPDSSLHGRGFVARLSGATAEFVNIWFIIMTGGTPFSLDKQGKLRFSIQPKLPGWLFPEDGILSFRFLGKIDVNIYNPSRLNTWESSPTRYTLRSTEKPITITGASIDHQYSMFVRDGKFTQIDIFYGS